VKRIALLAGVFSLLAIARPAFAQAPTVPDEEEKKEEEKKTDKKPGEVSSAILTDDSGRNVGVAKKNQSTTKKKAWTAGGVFETHRLLRQQDLQGMGRNKTMNYLFLFAGYGITPYDRLQVRTGVYQRFLADQGETGVRMDDIEPMYTRVIPLPGKLTMRASGSVILPLSFESQMMDLICTPRILTQFDRRFGTLNLTLRGNGAYWITKYKTERGGDPNPYMSFSTSLTAEYAMPFHESLSVGAVMATGIALKHDPTNANDPNVRKYGVVDDPNYGQTQPINNTYGGEVYVRYILPELNAVKSDFTIGYANGDYAVGYMRMNRDGINRVYGFFRTNAEVYAELGIRY
jgi:hypothetical protein